jgi:probable phosphoglycerate mutase
VKYINLWRKKKKLASKKIYLVRHGETEYNRTGVVQGSGVNSALNKNGYKQADLFFDAYKDFPFERVYTSSLRRTIQSVQKFIDKGIPHKILPGLNEISWGKSEGVAFSPQTNKMYYGMINSWKEGNIYNKLEGGESPVEVKARQETAVKYIIENGKEFVLVCMHGRAMKILLAWITDHSVVEMDKFEHENLSLYILDYNVKKFKIERRNDITHLNGFKSTIVPTD